MTDLAKTRLEQLLVEACLERGNVHLSLFEARYRGRVPQELLEQAERLKNLVHGIRKRLGQPMPTWM